MSGVPTEGKEFGSALFGACYLRYFNKRRETQTNVIKQIRSGRVEDITHSQEEMEMASRSLLCMGAGSVVGGVSMYLLRTLQRRVLRSSPSFVLTGALVAVGSLGGAVGSMFVSNPYERQNLQAQPLIVADRYCPAYLEFAPCIKNKDCMEATARNSAQQRLLSGYYQCKSREEASSE